MVLKLNEARKTGCWSQVGSERKGLRSSEAREAEGWSQVGAREEGCWSQVRPERQSAKVKWGQQGNCVRWE